MPNEPKTSPAAPSTPASSSSAPPAGATSPATSRPAIDPTATGVYSRPGPQTPGEPPAPSGHPESLAARDDAPEAVPNQKLHPRFALARKQRRAVAAELEQRELEEATKLPGLPPEGGEVVGQRAKSAAAALPRGPIVFNPTAPAIEFADSTNVKTAQLDPASGVVAVVFANGAAAKFGGFTPELLEQWRAAPSAGKWFHANVRNNAKTPLLESVKK